MPGNRPIGRKTTNSGSGKVFKRGSGLNLGGSVGNGGGYSGRPGMGSGSTGGTFRGSSSGGSSGGYGGGFFGGGVRGPRGGIGCLTVIIIAVVVIFLLVKCGSGLFSSFEGNPDNYTDSTSYDSSYGSDAESSYNTTDSGYGSLYQMFGGSSASGGSFSAYETSGLSNNSGRLDTTVASGTREKYTQLKGNGKDSVTVMIYMCGADLESQNAAATHDIQEMLGAKDTDNINLLIYTGGSKRWQNNVVSSSTNQVYKIESGEIKPVIENAGKGAMTDPDTLVEYIKWAAKNYPADRYELIFWDHGSGSVGGYGYDEKNPTAGSMTLAQINDALDKAGVKFDFIGFDACLMATLENGLMLSQYADYMIASEETEPADGWYYTDWLTQLSQNTSTPTIEIGRSIADTYYKANQKYSAYSGITLSMVDLAELQTTVPVTFADFSKSISGLIDNDEYKTVSNARSKTKEFAASSKIDQVDLVNLADNLNNDEAKELIETIQSAVKYNITSSNMATAYGLSVYFPYRKLSNVDEMTETYEAIGLSEDYTKCITDFASQQTAGQIGGGGSLNPYGSLFGGQTGGSLFGYDYSGNGSSGSYDTSNYSGSMTSELLMQLLSSALSGQYSGISSLASGNMQYMDADRLQKNADYVMENSIDPTKIVWTKNAEGQAVLGLTEKEWALIDTLHLNVLYDDGTGYIDLGLDTVYEWDDDGNLLGTYDRSWLAVDGQPVAYYHVSTEGSEEDYTIKGYIPAFVNGERANLLVIFDSEKPDGYIYGVQRVYDHGETDTEAKMYDLKNGDKIDFVCDYYSYEGDFENNYYLGDQMTVSGTPVLSNVTVGAKANAAYRLTDIYDQKYWTPVITW
ncbi:MAG: clostripain-related cysteine peptidase [Lachnospiraceae bacterium]|nr:clostripain-related cysteine peptidase [Lachnospiraceae bacterium]